MSRVAFGGVVVDWLNYHHLLYFWVAAREGSITKACRTLHLAQPTVSGQIKALEKSLKAKLFDRAGRSIVTQEISWQHALQEH